MNSECLAVLVQRYLLTKPNRQTQSWYRRSLRPLVEYFGEETHPGQIRRVEAENYWVHLNQHSELWSAHPGRPTVRKPLAASTLNNYLRAVRTFFSELVRQRVVEYNPFDHLSAPRDKRPPEMRAITPEDLRLLWQEAARSTPRDYALVTVLATTGLRAGELESMDIDRLDLTKGEAWVQGKRGWRKLFLGKKSVSAIEAYLEVRPNVNTKALWISFFGRRLSKDGMRQLIDRLADNAGIRGRHNLHSFRHRVAQAWLDNGVNAELLSQALGHANVNVTLYIYGNQDHHRVAQMMDKAEMLPFSG